MTEPRWTFHEQTSPDAAGSPRHVLSAHDAAGVEVGHLKLRTDLDAGTTYIEHVMTADTHRHQGVASALMDEWMARHPTCRIRHGALSKAGRGWRDRYRSARGLKPWR
jgi:hypothetical protein